MEIPIHVIDFEGSFESGVLEWGVVSLLGEEIISARTSLCRTDRNISTISYSQHGLNADQLRDYKVFDSNFEVFASLRETGPMCAHNASVEERFLQQTWPFTRKSPDFSKTDKKRLITTWGPWVDTLQIYRRLYPDLNSYKLSDLVNIFELNKTLGILADKHCPKKRTNYHCALYDALASSLLLKRLFVPGILEHVSLLQLFELSSASSSVFNGRRQQELF
tara:strand:+ start:981 stop:1643 length:663 start_codon:yes stop_codon:yes gene_type:complete